LKASSATIRLEKLAGGGPLSIEPRLKVGESRMLWLSNQGLLDLHIASKRWDYADGLQLTLSAHPVGPDSWCPGLFVNRTYNDLRPDVKTTHLNWVHARTNVQVLDRGAKGYEGTIVAGDHTIEILQVRLDGRARFSNGRCFTSKADFPSVHVQLRVTRSSTWVGPDVQQR
jgi:hypothetical protein